MYTRVLLEVSWIYVAVAMHVPALYAFPCVFFFVVTETPPVRGAGGLSASTVERLQSFSCPAEPNRSGAGKEKAEQKEPGGGASQICGQEKGVMPPCGIKDQHNNTKNLKQEQEEEHEEEEAMQEERSVVSPKPQVLVVNTVVICNILFNLYCLNYYYKIIIPFSALVRIC